MQNSRPPDAFWHGEIRTALASNSNSPGMGKQTGLLSDFSGEVAWPFDASASLTRYSQKIRLNKDIALPPQAALVQHHRDLVGRKPCPGLPESQAPTAAL